MENFPPTSPECVPVIIGVGQVNDRPADPADGMDSFELMREALAAAERDTRIPLLHRLDWLGVVDQISFPDPEIHHRLAATLLPAPPCVVRTKDASGDGPTRLISDAANLIGSGRVRIAAAVGGEALRTAARRAQAAASVAGAKTDRLAQVAEAAARPLARRYGLLTPTDVYPLYENATRAAWGQSLGEAQAETSAIWSGFSQTAAANPNAWLRQPMTAAQIADISAENRLVSFPYSKLMVANSSVNQGAAVILASLAMALEFNIPEERLVYVGASAASHEDEDFLCRDDFTSSASLTASIEKALAFNRLDAREIDRVELYSCFPCVPKMARRVLNWPIERPHSVYGGLTFGGGPIGNCMMHAAAAMVEALRGTNGHGLLVSNGGFATHNHALVLGGRPIKGVRFPQDYDVQAVADRLRGPEPELLDAYVGPGSVETYIVPYRRDGVPAFATIVARTPNGARFLAHVPADDETTIAFLLSGEEAVVGSTGRTVPLADGRQRWIGNDA